MRYLEQLRERRKAPVAVKHAITIAMGASRYEFAFVVEAEDDEEFYTDKANEVWGTRLFQVYLGKGKGGVLGVRDELDRDGRFLGRVLFFIDRDHDDFLGISHVRGDTYVTDSYSVEWEFCSKEVFLSVLSEACIIHRDDEVLAQAGEVSKSQFNYFVRRARLVMAIIIFLRRKDFDPKVKLLKFSSVFRWEGMELRGRRLSVADVLGKLDVTVSVTFRDLLQVARELRVADDDRVIRGKLAVEFVCEILGRLVEEGACHKANGEPLKLRSGIGRGNYCHVAVRKTEAPASLIAFLKGAELR